MYPSGLFAAGEPGESADPAPAAVTAKLDAGDPLLLAGLRRAASLAGVDVTDDRATATMAIRSAGAGEPHPRLDLEVSAAAVVMRIDRTPDRVAWRRLRRVLDVLYGTPGGEAEA